MLLKTNSYRTLLMDELARRQKINPLYSQRAFARQMGMSPGELSEILRGKRHLSLKSALKVARSLGLNSTEAKHLLHLTQLEKSRDLGQEKLISNPEPIQDVEQMSMDMFHLVSDWYCLTMLSLADCADFKWEPNWIGRKLGISGIAAKAALDRLERVGLVKTVNGKKLVVKDYILSPSGVSSEAIRNYHRTILKKATDALEFQTVQEREISGISLAIDPKDMESIRRDIQEFQDQLAAKYSRSKKRSEVYQLEVAFIRLTEGAKNEI